MDNSESAFPLIIGAEQYSEGGLTKREYFAAKALQGILASGEFHTIAKANCRALSVKAFAYADEMIKESTK